MASYYRIHRIAPTAFSVTLVREGDEEGLPGFAEVGRFPELNEAMRFAADRGAVAIDFDVMGAPWPASTAG